MGADVQRWLVGLGGLLSVDYLFQEMLSYQVDADDAELTLMRTTFEAATAVSEHLDHVEYGAGFAEHLGDAIATAALGHVRAVLEGGPPDLDQDRVWEWAGRTEHARDGVDRPAARAFLFTGLSMVLDDPPPALRAVVAGDQVLARLHRLVRDGYGRPDPASPTTVLARSFVRHWHDLVAGFTEPDPP